MERHAPRPEQPSGASTDELRHLLAAASPAPPRHPHPGSLLPTRLDGEWLRGQREGVNGAAWPFSHWLPLGSSQESPASARGADGAVWAPGTSPGGGVEVGGDGCQQPPPPTAQQLIASLPGTAPSIQNHDTGRKTEAQSQKWLVPFTKPGNGSCQEALAGDQVTAHSQGPQESLMRVPPPPATRPSWMVWHRRAADSTGQECRTGLLDPP